MTVAADNLTEGGYSIYDRGVSADGREIVGRTAGIDLLGARAACANCHGDPLDGGNEGGVIAPALAWDSLSNDRLAGAAYDRTSFERAANQGISVDGRNLHALMPRFDLTDAEIDALLDYLQQDHMIPGVSQDSFTVATILPGDPQLRALGSASAQTVGRAIEESEDRFFGRRLRHVVLDAALPIAEFERQLESDMPAVVIASIGLNTQGPIAELLGHRRILNFAPIAAMTGNHSIDAVLPLLPDLRQQSIVLAREAQEQHGCVDLAFADEAVSASVAQSISLLIEITPGCPAILLLSNHARLEGVVAGLGDRRIERIYASADQIGPDLPLLARACALTVSATSDENLAATVERNATASMEVLSEALAKSGRRFSRRALAENIRSSFTPRSPILVRIDQATDENAGCCRGAELLRCGASRQAD